MDDPRRRLVRSVRVSGMLWAWVCRLVGRLFILLIRGYQRAFSWKGPTCRYWPTCSQYAIDAIEKYGPWRGGWMAVCRIARCHPFRPGGYDPVR